MYSVKKDLQKNRIYATLKGMISPEEAKEYFDNFVKEIDYFYRQSTPFTVLADIREFKTSSQDVKQIFVDIQKISVQKGLIKSAVIMPESALSGLQGKTIAKESGVAGTERYFSNLSDAEKYLDE